MPETQNGQELRGAQLNKDSGQGREDVTMNYTSLQLQLWMVAGTRGEKSCCRDQRRQLWGSLPSAGSPRKPLCAARQHCCEEKQRQQDLNASIQPRETVQITESAKGWAAIRAWWLLKNGRISRDFYFLLYSYVSFGFSTMSLNYLYNQRNMLCLAY